MVWLHPIMRSHARTTQQTENSEIELSPQLSSSHKFHGLEQESRWLGLVHGSTPTATASPLAITRCDNALLQSKDGDLKFDPHLYSVHKLLHHSESTAKLNLCTSKSLQPLHSGRCPSLHVTRQYVLRSRRVATENYIPCLPQEVPPMHLKY